MNDKHKLIPKRRFKEFENADAWEQRKLGNVAKYRNGKAHEQSVSENGKYVIVNSKFVSTNGEVQKFSCEQIEPLFKNEIAFVLSDVPNGRAIARTFLIPHDDKYTLNQRIAGITPNETTDSYFLHLLMNRNHYFLRFDDGVKQTNLSVNDVMGFSTYYPLYEEQQLCGQFFKKIDNLITLHQRKLNKLEEIKSAYLAEMFPIQGEFKPKRRFSGFKEDWNWSALKEIGNTFTGLSGKTKEDFGHGEAKFITYMNVYSNPISDLNGLENIEIDKKQFQVKYGDVLFTTSSETPEEVGMSSVWLGNEEDVYLNSFCFGFRPSVDIDNYYLAFMLRSVSIRKKFQLLAQGISRYNISKNKVMEMSIPLPCIDEQKKIGLLFKNIEQTIHSQKETVKKLINLKNAYLNEMFV